MTVVLDASALLAYLQDEPGSEAVEAVLAESVMSSVNWAEVVQKSVAAGVVVDGMREDLEALGLTIAPFSLEDADMVGRLWLQTRQAGLSLGDRACLSLGMRLNVPVLTCDRLWATLGLALDVQVIR
ncbi:type II toxin-antitoxin system VapC family toxin [Halotia branconii]|uniref:Type II toxin-antitoxin system VapC family toxin n=1 Tax=Halotia branconii CENA392 TaxID=1539056 RepID=A0AAJ6NSM5_9CYAN|nr:type II toxin-antitoxin system VapC family toxin [Halotia branconii]WGV25877.1 type II toxin-antitoxin system VapC family toxin [Halotia branconii CENA392]